MLYEHNRRIDKAKGKVVLNNTLELRLNGIRIEQ